MENRKKDGSRNVLAIILIVIGMLWLLRQIGIHIRIPHEFIENLFYPIKYIFHNWGHFIFSWPMILIIIGTVLAAGKRKSGVVLIIIGGVFLLPRIFSIHWLTTSMILPLILIGIGVALVARKL